MSSMKAYLAEKYMSGPKADAILARTGTKKKKRSKAATSTATGSGAIVRDDDAGWGAGWGDEGAKEEAEDVTEAVVASDRRFKKRKTEQAAEGGGWATIEGGMREITPPPAADEQPMVVDEPAAPFTGGLVSAKQLKKAMGAKKKDTQATQEEIAAAQETVYRDTTGKKIDTKAERAEAARLKREREEREAKKMEWGKGLVQRDEQEKRRKELESQQGKDFARYADDKDLNEELKSKELWNDPAAAFMTKKRTKGPRKPEYAGPLPAPNRFGIKPGYRWDGVDRSNGFEKKFFQTQNSRKRQGQESHQWSVEDM